ncbi:hypothetical protein [Fibrobacter sp. UWH1]|uniref:hypothetical protein n=1 Tax=Fibrobacter sp. UWH1 TaxID=1964354 RepID=UPI000B528E71|nr:hypothetical protein [Fibrobacter sp. UWH1]OWV05258.1 hypothetical protein B7992_15525 [Fibrobacter sp. UWH1]
MEQQKNYNEPTGILCPVCQKIRIKMTLGDFLYGDGFTCPCCKTKFSMDKSQCAGTLEKLQELYSATKEVERLKKQSL